MPSHRRTAGVLALTASLSLAATALASTPKKGAKFDGTASGTVQFATSFTAKDQFAFTVSSNSKKLLNVSYTDNVCDLASSKIVKIGTVKVTAGGRFSVSKLKSAPESDSLQDGSTVVTTTSLSGRFSSAKKATGTLEYSQKQTGASSASCGPIKLKLSLSAS